MGPDMIGHRKPAYHAAAFRTPTQIAAAFPLADCFPLQTSEIAFNPLDVLAWDAALELAGIHMEPCPGSSFGPKDVGTELITPLRHDRLSTSLDLAEEPHLLSFGGRS